MYARFTLVLCIAFSLSAALWLFTGCDRAPTRADPVSAEQSTRSEQGALARNTPEEATDNRPPVIDDLSFDPSKFVSCEETTRICVRGSDAEGDALEIEWSADPELELGPEVVSTERDDNVIEQCIRVRPAPGRTEMEVRVVESNTSEEATDTLEFPVYMSEKHCS